MMHNTAQKFNQSTPTFQFPTQYTAFYSEVLLAKYK